MSPPPNPGNSALRIVIQGYVVRCPLGAMVWHYLQFVLGLMELGHDVMYTWNFLG